MKKCINGVYIEMTQQEIEDLKPTLEDAIKDKLRRLDDYDTSNNVNEFFVNGQGYWLDKSTRVGIVNAINLIGGESYDIWFNDIMTSLPVSVALGLMQQIERYAALCYNVTASHKSAIKALTNVDDVLSYDYTVGYPNKLTFNI